MEVVRSSLEVGFAGELPEAFRACRGRAKLAIPKCDEFPFEDAQFEVVMIEGSAVDSRSIREAHRVLRPEGRLMFILPEKTSCQSGWSIPEIYQLVCDGFHIIAVGRPAWWFFRRTGRTLTITAKKKNWRKAKCCSFRPSYSLH